MTMNNSLVLQSYIHNNSSSSLSSTSLVIILNVNHKHFIRIPVLTSQCEKLNTKAAKSCFIGTLPIVSWLHSYQKDDFVADLISGCTVAVMHIPQGMGYALLANLPPVVGIYMAFFPVLMYTIFGTSRHNSMGMSVRGMASNISFVVVVVVVQELSLSFRLWWASVSALIPASRCSRSLPMRQT